MIVSNGCNRCRLVAQEFPGRICRRSVDFVLKALNIDDRTKDHRMQETHEFTALVKDMGFPEFLTHERLANERGLVVDNQITVEVGGPHCRLTLTSPPGGRPCSGAPVAGRSPSLISRVSSSRRRSTTRRRRRGW
jgi:hypothetical protein